MHGQQNVKIWKNMIVLYWREAAVPLLWPVPEAAVTVLVLLMMGAVTSETCSDFSVYKYLHTVASGWIFINIESYGYILAFFTDNIPLCFRIESKIQIYVA